MRLSTMLATAGLLALTAFAGEVSAATQGDGAELARAVHERPDGDDAVTHGTMTLTGAGRRERVRESYEYRLDGEAGESWNLIRFTVPRNIADTALLVHNRPDGEVDQWLYLPALQRERRISSENRGGSFVQSELYFEDLEDREPHKDHHEILGQEMYEDVEVTLLESVPVDPDNSVYSKRVSWVHEQTLIPLRIDFYEGGDEPSKRLEVQEILDVQGYWTVMRSSMTDLASGRVTVLEVDEVIYDNNLPRDLFTTRGLADPQRARPYRPERPARPARRTRSVPVVAAALLVVPWTTISALADGHGGQEAAPVEQGVETYTVRASDTLWSIAERVRPDATIGTRAMAEALFKNNPHAFDGGMNRMYAGAVLRTPSAVAAPRDAGPRGAPPQSPAAHDTADASTAASAEAPDDDRDPPQRGFTFGEPEPRVDEAEAAPDPAPNWDLRTDDVLVEAGALASSDRPVDTTQYARATATATRRLGDAWELRLGARGDLQAQQGGPFPSDTRVRVDYDENYLRYRGPDSRITVGTQRILWGRVDEIAPTDRLSTKDLTRFGLDDYAERRRANPALRAEYFQGPWHVDLVFLPVFREAELPDRDSLWHPVDRTRGRLLGLPNQPALAPIIRQARLDDSISGDGGGGLRLSRMGQGADFALTIQRARHSEPYYRLDAATRQAVLSGTVPTHRPVLEAVHPRTWVVGGDAAFATGAWTWRAEAAWLSDVPATREADLRQITTEGLDWVVGVEGFPGDGDFRVTQQLAGQHLDNAGGVLDATERYFLTGEFELPFYAHTWRARLRYSLGLDRRDIYANPELAWIANEPMEFYVGAHWLDGNDSQTAGGFYRHNRTLVMGWRGQF